MSPRLPDAAPSEKLLLTTDGAAALVPYEAETIRRAVCNCHIREFPYMLRAKRGSRGEFLITPQALRDWIDMFPDA